MWGNSVWQTLLRQNIQKNSVWKQESASTIQNGSSAEQVLPAFGIKHQRFKIKRK